MTRYRAVLIGLGQIGCGYDLLESFQWDVPFSSESTYTHARALACHPSINFIAGIDSDVRARDRFSSIYHIPSFANLADFIYDNPNLSIDIAIVAVPPTLQPQVVESLLDLITPRLLLLEKPLATDSSSLNRLFHVIKASSSTHIAVNYVRRYLPAVLQLQAQIASGKYGNLLHARLIYGKGLLSNASHFINLAESWVGPLIHKQTHTLGSPIAGFDSEASITLSSEIYPDALFHISSVGSSYIRAGELDLWFSAGRILWNNDGKHISLWHLGTPFAEDTHRPLVDQPILIDTGIKHYQYYVVHNLVSHLLYGDSNPINCDFQSGMHTLQLLNSSLNA